MKIKWKTLILCLALPLAVGGLSGWLSREGMKNFGSLNQPPLSPPDWLFPIAWTILYLLMGLASYYVAVSDAPRVKVRAALWVYGIQLCFNFLWTIFFFNLGQYLFSFLWLMALWLLILASTVLFRRVDRRAAYLMIPYIAWVAFAGYLNWGIYRLNG